MYDGTQAHEFPPLIIVVSRINSSWFWWR